MTEQNIAGELVEIVPEPADPLCVAFAAAMAAVMGALPPGRARDLAVIEMMEAHARAARAISKYRVLN